MKLKKLRDQKEGEGAEGEGAEGRGAPVIGMGRGAGAQGAVGVEEEGVRGHGTGSGVTAKLDWGFVLL